MLQFNTLSIFFFNLLILYILCQFVNKYGANHVGDATKKEMNGSIFKIVFCDKKLKINDRSRKKLSFEITPPPPKRHFAIIMLFICILTWFGLTCYASNYLCYCSNLAIPVVNLYLAYIILMMYSWLCDFVDFDL